MGFRGDVRRRIPFDERVFTMNQETPTVEALLQRIETLEKFRFFSTLAWAGVALGAITLVAVVSARLNRRIDRMAIVENPDFKTVTADAVVIRDDAGTRRAVLGRLPEAPMAQGLIFYDSTGQADVASLTAWPDGSRLDLSGDLVDDTRTTAVLEIRPGSAELFLRSSAGQVKRVQASGEYQKDPPQEERLIRLW